MEVLAGAGALELPDWYLIAGCLYQTVWNVVTGQPPEAGILDYDLAYFDGLRPVLGRRRTSMIKAGQQTFAGSPAPVQIRNQARVHLWYEQKYGVPCPPHESTEAAIDTFEATTACLGVRVEQDGRWRIYAPHGLVGRVQPGGGDPIRCSRRGTSTGPRPRAGGGSGPD